MRREQVVVANGRRLAIRGLLALAIAILGILPALAATITVNPGEDIQAAIDGALAGDTILLAAGTHSITTTVEVNKSVKITGAGATVQGTNTTSLSVFKITSSNVAIQNLDITWSHVLEDSYAAPETADSLISVMGGIALTDIVIANNELHVPYQGDTMKLWGARALTVDSNSCSGITITGNTVYNTRNGIVVRYGNTAVVTDNVVYNTKGGIMQYTSSQADADNRTMSGNTWSTAHNEWDIVWNSASYDPDYVGSVLAVSIANGDGYVVDRRDAAGGHAVGNRSHVFLNSTTGLNKVHEALGNMNEPFATFALGVDAVIADGTLYVDIGTYQEQVIVGKDLEIAGAGAGAIVVAPTTPGKYKIAESTATWEPVIFLYGGTDDGSGNVSGAAVSNIDIHDLTVDGNDRTPTDRSAGILLRNIAGTIAGNTVQNMNIDGKQTFGIVVYGDSDVVIDGNTVKEFSRGGIGVMSGYAIISNNLVLGPGLGVPVTWAPNGIQIGYGAEGTISGNEVAGCGWPGTDWAGTAIMVVDTSNVVVENNYVHDNETGIGVTDFPEAAYGASWAGNVSNIIVQGNSLDQNEWALDIANEADNVSVLYNVISNSVYDGIDVWSYDYYWPGLGIPFPTNVVIHYNSITGSGGDGLWVMDGIGTPVNATLNWWGDNDGPSGEGTGAGDSVSTNVIFSPWLGIDPDGDPGTVGVQLISPLLFIVDDIGPAPALGYLGAAIDAANMLPGIDSIEVRHGTYDATEPIVDGVNIYSEVGSASSTFLNGPISINVSNVLLGKMRQGFTINGDITVGAGIDASNIHINWNDLLGIVTNNGTGTLDAIFNYWGEDGPDTVGDVAIYPLLPIPSDTIIGYMDEHGLSALDAIDFATLLDLYLSERNALAAVELMNAFGFSSEEAATLVKEYGALAVDRALAFCGGDYEDFLALLVGYASGGGGGGSFLGGGVGGTAAMPGFCVGCSVPLQLELVHPITGEPITDAVVSYSVCKTLPDGTAEIVALGVMTYDGDLGAYTFDVDTTGYEPGIYDIYLGTDDGRSRHFQVEVVLIGV